MTQTAESTLMDLERYLKFAVENVERHNNPHILGLHGFVLKYGQAFTSEPLTPEEIVIVKDALRQFNSIPEPKMCFSNSQILAAYSENKLRYVEGWCGHLIPFAHGWCEINGKVVDITLRKDFDSQGTWEELLDQGEWTLGEFSPEYAYFGVVFPDILEILDSDSFGDSLIDDWGRGWPLMADHDLYGKLGEHDEL